MIAPVILVAIIIVAVAFGGCSDRKEDIINQMAEDFIHLTGPDNQSLSLNPAGVVLRPPRHPEHFARGIKCIVTMPNGQFVSVKEDCAEVEQQLKPFH